ncbi:hypothetical protein SLA2020_351380 [Shorea laevis]
MERAENEVLFRVGHRMGVLFVTEQTGCYTQFRGVGESLRKHLRDARSLLQYPGRELSVPFVGQRKKRPVETTERIPIGFYSRWHLEKSLLFRGLDRSSEEELISSCSPPQTIYLSHGIATNFSSATAVKPIGIRPLFPHQKMDITPPQKLFTCPNAEAFPQRYSVLHRFFIFIIQGPVSPAAHIFLTLFLRTLS